ncbi:unnamed protein product, partial [Lymnaea stagnalis]
GQNVALKQSAAQSTVYAEGNFNGRAENAVDGDANSDGSYGSCSHTCLADPSPRWNVTLDNTYVVNKFVVYSRMSSQNSRKFTKNT